MSLKLDRPMSGWRIFGRLVAIMIYAVAFVQFLSGNVSVATFNMALACFQWLVTEATL